MLDSASITFSSLADATRRAILTRLREGEATVNELAAPFDISLPAISRHLKVLENASLIVRTRDAQFRRCGLKPDGIKAAAEWIEEHRKFWSQQLDALAQFVDETDDKTSDDNDDN